MPLLQVKADMALSDVLGGLTPDAEENDYIKSQVKFAQHYGQYGWHGQLKTLPTDAMYKASPTFRDAPSLTESATGSVVACRVVAASSCGAWHARSTIAGAQSLRRRTPCALIALLRG